ncbi:DNA-3-methyladenine glycosylase family protein [Cytobacillus sp. FSL K6-0265]|uniref:DNA-3-methyladenine glycosylase family protein n=1 Tax=Cytobacillus sp. FSL K6-0265 TaxID=2921448 RepID=UPI0030FC35A6
MEIIKEIAGPYNFDAVLSRLSSDPLLWVNRERRMLKVPLKLQNESIVVTITGLGTTNKPKFHITGLNEATNEEALVRLTEIFRWNIPLAGVHQHFLKTDLRHIFLAHYGTPFVLDFDLFGSLLKCIVHQQLNMKFAYTLTMRFVQKFGYEIDGVWFYPDPATVADLTIEDLRALQFSGRKSEYVIGIAKELAEKQLSLLQLKELSDREIHDKLIKLKGIGPWTVQNFLMFGLGRENLYPMADIGLQNALKQLYQLDKKPSYEQMELYAKDWTPYLSYATYYLWRSIE